MAMMHRGDRPQDGRCSSSMLFEFMRSLFVCFVCCYRSVLSTFSVLVIQAVFTTRRTPRRGAVEYARIKAVRCRTVV